MKKRILILAAALMLCACQSASPGGDSPGGTLKDAEISVISPFAEGDGRREDYLSLISGFSEETGIIVNDLSNERSSEKWKTDVVSLFDTGDEPDVIFFFNGVTAAPIIESGNVIDLETIQAKYPDYALNIKLGVLNSMKYDDGKNYCVPATGFWESCFVNMGLFEENGLEYPETFEELIEAAPKLRAAGITPVAANIKQTPHYLFEYLIYNYTGPSNHEYFVTEGDNYKHWTKGLEQFNVMYEAGLFPDDLENATDEKCLEMFLNKEAAITVDGSWSSILKQTEDAVVAPFPAPAQGSRKNTDIIGGFSMGYFITKKGWENNSEACVKFVSHMTGDPALELFNKDGSASPGVGAKSRTDSAIIASVTALVDNSTAFIPAVQDSFKPEAREYIFSEIINITKGEKDISDVLDKFIGLSE